MDFRNRADADLDLSKYGRIVKRRWPIALLVFGGSLGFFIFLAGLIKPSYVAEGKLLFRRAEQTSPLAGLGVEVAPLESLLSNQTPLSTEIELLKSSSLLQQTIDRLGLVDAEGEPMTPEQLREVLGVEITSSTDIISLSYKDRDPAVAAAVINTLMDIYLNRNIEKSNVEMVAARDFVETKLLPLKSNLVQVESALRQFKESNSIVDLPAETQATAAALETLNQQLIAATAESRGITAQATQLRDRINLDPGDAVSVSIVGQAPEVRAVLEELALVERDLAEARESFREVAPQVISLKNKQQLLEARLDEVIQQAMGRQANVQRGLLQLSNQQDNVLRSYILLEGQRANLEQRLQTLNLARAEYVKRAKAIPLMEQYQAQLQRDVDLARAGYQSLLKKYQEIQLSEDKPVSLAEVVTPAAVPKEADSSSKIMLLAAGVIVSSFASSLSILISELRDRSVKDLDEIKGTFYYPLLGAIPELKSLSKLPQLDRSSLVANLPRDSFDAAPLGDIYWMLQANLKIINAHRALKVIVVTSSVAQEGKSTISANLAVALSQSKNRVLLIDADMQSPSQHLIWNLHNQEGLGDLISSNSPLKSGLVKATRKLEVLTAGPETSQSLSLLDSAQMVSLLGQARDNFDYVIIDAPPLANTADALALGQMSDGILLVARPKVLDHQSAASTQKVLAGYEDKVLGVVVNGLPQNEFSTTTYPNKELARIRTETPEMPRQLPSSSQASSHNSLKIPSVIRD